MYLKKEVCACLVACLALFGLILSQHPATASSGMSVTTVADGPQPPPIPPPPPPKTAAVGAPTFASQGTPVLVADGPQPPPIPPRSNSATVGAPGFAS